MFIFPWNTCEKIYCEKKFSVSSARIGHTCSYMNTLDNFVKKMATPQTRANTKKADKTSSEKTSEKTNLKDHTTMSEVTQSRSLNLIHKDLAEVKAEMRKTIKEENLESLVSSIVSKIIEQITK